MLPRTPRGGPRWRQLKWRNPRWSGSRETRPGPQRPAVRTVEPLANSGLPALRVRGMLDATGPSRAALRTRSALCIWQVVSSIRGVVTLWRVVTKLRVPITMVTSVVVVGLIVHGGWGLILSTALLFVLG